MKTEETNVITHTKGWLAATQSRAASVADLALAEAKLAAISVAMMAFFGALAAAFAAGAWALAVAAVIKLLGEQGISIWAALLSIALIHFVAAILLWRTARKLGTNLEFKATRSQLSGAGQES